MYVKKFGSIIRQIFDFFDNSAVRTAGLKAVQSLLKEKGALVAPSSTRWLSVDKSVLHLKSSRVSVITSLDREGEERADARAVGLSKMIREYRFIATMLLMCDALPHIRFMSKCFHVAISDYSMKFRHQHQLYTITDTASYC